MFFKKKERVVVAPAGKSGQVFTDGRWYYPNEIINISIGRAGTNNFEFKFGDGSYKTVNKTIEDIIESKLKDLK